MIHAEVVQDKSFENFVDQLQILKNDDKEIILQCAKLSLINFYIKATNVSSTDYVEVYVSLDGKDYYAYSIISRKAFDTYITDTPKPLRIEILGDGTYTYTLDLPIPINYIKLVQQNDSNLEIILTPDRIW